MEEFVNAINEEELEEISGGAGTAKKHVKIVNCKICCNVRSTPDSTKDTNKIGKAYLGDSYVFYAWNGNWAKVQFGGRKGYIHGDFIELV